MATASELTILHLKDNHPNDRSQVEIISAKDRAVLRYLSSHSLSEMKNDKGCDILVFPHSFKETKDEIGDSYVLSYAEDKEGSTESITTGNLVGFIECNGMDIRIHSRFSYGENDEVKDYFLYYMLGKVLSLNFFDLNTSSSHDDAIFDFLLFFFPKLLKEAMSQGMYKKYVYHEYNDANVRGVIDINRHIRRNIPANGKIAYRTREFSYDNPVTQLIRHTIEFIRRKTFGKAVLHNDPDTEGYVQQIIQATPSFQPRQMQSVINENLRPVSHPYYTKYAALQKLCLRILRHEKLSYGENGDKIHGILIDAAWLWEEYIAQVLSERTGMKHYTRKSSPYHLLEKDGRGIQKIIPDYLDVDNKIVADAKYIPLIKDELSAEKAAPVYYKTIMYMYRFDAKKGFLFHPVAKKKDDETGEIVAEGNEQVIENDYTIEGREDCHLYKVGLVVEENGDWASYRKTMKDREEDFLGIIKSKF